MNILIKKHSRKELPLRVKWLNNPQVNHFLGDTIGQTTTLLKEQAWFKNYEKAKNKQFFTIFAGTKAIGWMGLSNINKTNQNADLFIAIGEDDYRGKGIGKIAMNWIINYAFQKLKLHKINLGVMEENLPAVKLYLSLGFEIEGRMKDELFHQGKYYHFLSMALFN